jgi:hypothetical protein
MKCSIDDQISCIRREVSLRERNYPAWVESNRMSQTTADVEIERMKAALDTLVQIRRAIPQLERLLHDLAPLNGGTTRELPLE